MVYSQKLLFSLRCPLELFGLYQSLACRIYLVTYPWAPCRSKHHPGKQVVKRLLKEMKKGQRENSEHLSGRTTSCLSFWRKCTVALQDLKGIHKQARLSPKSKLADSQAEAARDHIKIPIETSNRSPEIQASTVTAPGATCTSLPHTWPPPWSTGQSSSKGWS